VPAVIVKTGAKLRGSRTYGLVYYLMGPGRVNEHVDPRVIAGYKPAAELAPPARTDGRAGVDVRGLVAALDRPVARLGDRAPVRHVFHTVIANREEDPVLSDGQWADISYELMRELGLAGTEQGARDIRWVAIRHDLQHVHLAGTLARADGSVAATPNDFRAASTVRARMEVRYGLGRTNSGDRTSTRRPERAETEKATRQGRGETERDTLRRLVRFAAAAAESPEGFRAGLGAAGVRFTPRMSTQQPGEVTGYKVSLLPSVSTQTTVWFAGGQLDRDLTWPKLTGRWDTTATANPNPSGAVAAAPPVGDGAPERAQAACGAGQAAADAAAAVRADPAAVDEIAPAAADLAAATAGMWERRPDGRRPVAGFTRAGDLTQRAGRSPGGAAPAYGGQSTAMRAAVRRMLLAGQLSSGSDTAAWLALAAQVAVLLDAVADARLAQQRADQAAAARAAAAAYRAELERAGRDPAAAGAPLLVQLAARRAPAAPRPPGPGPAARPAPGPTPPTTPRRTR